MTNQSFVVIRLVPESPVDGTTFGYYLNDLSLQLVDANTGKTVTNQAFSSPLSVFPWPPGSDTYVTVASQLTSGAPTYNPNAHPADYGNELTFTLTDGISVGSFVVSADQTTIPANVNGKGLLVTAITSTKVTLSGDLPNYVPPGTPVSFVGQPQGNVDLTTAPLASFERGLSPAWTYRSLHERREHEVGAWIQGWEQGSSVEGNLFLGVIPQVLARGDSHSVDGPRCDSGRLSQASHRHPIPGTVRRSGSVTTRRHVLDLVDL